MNAISNIFDVPAQDRVLHLCLQQVERSQNGQTGLDQRDELLVEDNEILRIDRRVALPESAYDAKAPGLNGDGQKALLLQAMPDFFGALTNLNRLNDLAGGLGVFAREFHLNLLSEPTSAVRIV